MSGRGSKVMANGDSYFGEWKDDKADGLGVKTFTCGDRHSGEYEKDKRSGFGTYEWTNGKNLFFFPPCLAPHSLPPSLPLSSYPLPPYVSHYYIYIFLHTNNIR
jgi:hypothetical protein